MDRGPVIGEEHGLARVDARRHAGPRAHAVQPCLGPGNSQGDRVGLPVQERDRPADVGPEGRDEPVGLLLGRALVAPVPRVVVAVQELAGGQGRVRVATEAPVRVAPAAGRLHDHEVAGGHVGDDQVVLPARDVYAVKPHATRPS